MLEYRSAHLYAIENFEYQYPDAYFNKLAEVFTEDEDMLGMSVYQEYMKKDGVLYHDQQHAGIR